MGLFGVLRDPERRPDPEPLAVDLRLVIGAGTAVWCLAAVVAVVLHLAGALSSWTPAVICGVGAGLGLLAMLWYRRRLARGLPVS